MTPSTKNFRKGFRGQFQVYPQPMDPTPQIKVEIDDEFMRLMPTLDNAALGQLRESLVGEGCREPLIAWGHDGKYVLLDGHNRLALCTAENISYEVDIKSTEDIPDREAAIAWILRNQLGRRNLTQEQFTLYLGKLYNAQKAAHGGDRKSSAQNEHLIGAGKTTAEKLAEEHGVSAATVRRAGEFAEAVEKAKEQDPDIEQEVVKGKVCRKEIVEKAKPVAVMATEDAPKDAFGRIIPEHLRAIFAKQEDFRRFAQAVSTLKGQVRQAVEADPVAWGRFNENAFRAAMQKVHDLLAQSAPYIVCSYCGADHSQNCVGCKGTGFLTKAQARCVPEDLRR